MHSHRTLFECAAHARALGALDLVSKDVVTNAEVIAAPTHDARPSDPTEKPTARSAPSRSGHPSGDDPRERPQECLKCVAPPSANEQVQMGAHVGEVVDPDPEPLSHFAKGALHGGRVFTKRPGTASPVARKNDVHGAPHADRALELATPTPDGATMLGSHELSLH